MSRRLLEDFQRMIATQPVGFAQMIARTGGGPFGVGDVMLVGRDGPFLGSFGSGCLDAEVIIGVRRCLQRGEAAVLTLTSGGVPGFGDPTPCVGSAEVLVLPTVPVPWIEALKDPARHHAWSLSLHPDRLGAVRRLGGPRASGTGSAGESWCRVCAGGDGVSGTAQPRVRIVERGSRRTLIEHRAPPRRVIMVGATVVARSLALIISELGWRCEVIDPRSPFLHGQDFPPECVLRREWPDRALPGSDLGAADAVIVLSHQWRLDRASIGIALRGGAGFVGLMGSSRFVEAARASLMSEGFSPAEVARLRGPLGWPPRMRSPSSIAVAIAAELLSATG